MLNQFSMGWLDTARSFAPGPAIELTQEQMRGQFAVLAAAGLLLSISLGALALYFFFGKSRERTLIYFGIFCSLYAVRMSAQVPAFRALFDARPVFWVYLVWDITAVIILPAGLFFYEVWSSNIGAIQKTPSRQTRTFLRGLLIVQAVAGAAGITAAAMGMPLAPLFTANSLLLLASFVVLGGYLLFTRAPRSERAPMNREFRVLLAGFLVWFVFIIHANLLGLRLIRGPNLEFIGLLVFVAALGYSAASRTLAREEQLLAINKELEIARGIQERTLPQSVPQLKGLEIAARYVPMSAVAGDFYDFLVVDARRVGILIADVTGHGVPAAMIASMLKVTFAAQAAQASDPARMLDELNRALCGKFDEHFVTAAYVFIDLERSVMCYAGAAHPALMMVDGASGTVREAIENGLMLGMFTEAEYSAIEIPVTRGDRCVLCTDGILEARTAAGEEFGAARVAEFLKSMNGGDARETAGATADTLLAAVMRFAEYGSERGQDDDMTLIVLDFE